MVEKKVDVKEVRETENTLRDVRNWLAVFKTEYDIDAEAYKVLHGKIEDLATKVGAVKTNAKGVDAQSLKPASNALRDLKNWLAVFAKEYELAEEAVDVLHEQLDKVGQKIAAIKAA